MARWTTAYRVSTGTVSDYIQVDKSLHDSRLLIYVACILCEKLLEHGTVYC